LTDSGDFTKTAGTLTDSVFKLQMTGTSSTLSTNNVVTFYQLEISGTINLATTESFKNGIVDSGMTITIASSKYISWLAYSGNTFSNSGTVYGPGLMTIELYNADQTTNLGAFTSPLTIYGHSSSTDNRVITLSSALMCGALRVYSNSATKTCTLDLSSSNYGLSTASLSLETRGIINARGSAISCSGNWDSYNGTYIQGTSSLTLTGTSNQYCRLANGQSFNALIVSGSYRFIQTTGTFATSLTANPSATVSLGQNTAITNNVTISGILTENSHTLTISGSTTNPFYCPGTFDGTVILSSSATNYSVSVSIPMGGFIQSAKDLTILTDDPNEYVIMNPSSTTVAIQVRGWRTDVGLQFMEFNATATSGTVNFVMYGTQTNTSYNLAVDENIITGWGENQGPYIIFDYSSWSTHDFRIVGTPVNHDVSFYDQIPAIMMVVFVVCILPILLRFGRTATGKK
jgi:hypothetical protein